MNQVAFEPSLPRALATKAIGVFGPFAGLAWGNTVFLWKPATGILAGYEWLQTSSIVSFKGLLTLVVMLCIWKGCSLLASYIALYGRPDGSLDENDAQQLATQRVQRAPRWVRWVADPFLQFVFLAIAVGGAVAVRQWI